MTIAEAFFGPDPNDAQLHAGMFIAEIGLNLRHLTEVMSGAHGPDKDKRALQRRMPIRHLEKTLGRVSD